MVRQQLLNTNESATVAFCKTFHQLNKAQLISSPKESRTLCRSVDIGGQDIVIEKEKANKNKLSGKISSHVCVLHGSNILIRSHIRFEPYISKLNADCK
jgi:hypothetical protein